MIATYVSGTSFTVSGDKTDVFLPGVKIRCTCGTDGYKFGAVASAGYASNKTTVVMEGDALTSKLTDVLHGFSEPRSVPEHAAQHAADGGDPLTPADMGISAATTSASGLVALATSAEQVLGAEAAKVTTPASARQAYVSWCRDELGKFPGIIPPAFQLFAPNLALPSGATLARASSGWRLTPAGVLAEITSENPRFDYCENGGLLGVLVEPAATRLNTVCAAPSGAQTVTTTAQTYIVSFYGAGTVVLSGTHAATLTGSGVFPARTNYTFAATAGTLTLTCSGDVQYLQVVAGSVASSPILGEGSTPARAAETITAPLSGIHFNTAEGAVFVDAYVPYDGLGTGSRLLLQIDDGTVNNRLYLAYANPRSLFAYCYVGGASQFGVSVKSGVTTGQRLKVAFSWKTNLFRACCDGGPVSQDNSGSIPSELTTFRIGTQTTGIAQWGGPIRNVSYFPRALTDEQLAAITL